MNGERQGQSAVTAPEGQSPSSVGSKNSYKALPRMPAASKIASRNISYPDITLLTGMERRSSDMATNNSTIEDLIAKLKIENKIKEGAENLLQVSL